MRFWLGPFRDLLKVLVAQHFATLSQQHNSLEVLVRVLAGSWGLTE